MKINFLLILVVLCSNLYSQDKISVSSNKLDTYIETYVTSIGNNSYLKDAYRLGPSGLQVLKDGVKTALKWVDLNLEHNKTFEKEICRFKAMDKEKYKFFGYVDKFAVEMILNYKGYADGTFLLEFKKYDSNSSFIEFSEMDLLLKFRDLLDGKSVNRDIDEIFKK